MTGRKEGRLHQWCGELTSTMLSCAKLLTDGRHDSMSLLLLLRCQQTLDPERVACCLQLGLHLGTIPPPSRLQAASCTLQAIGQGPGGIVSRCCLQA